MREKYESLSLAVLRELAKARGLKKISSLKKQELIEVMLQEDEKENAQQAQPAGNNEKPEEPVQPKQSDIPVQTEEKKEQSAETGKSAGHYNSGKNYRTNNRENYRDNIRDNNRDNTRDNNRDNTRDNNRDNSRDHNRGYQRNNTARNNGERNYNNNRGYQRDTERENYRYSEVREENGTQYVQDPLPPLPTEASLDSGEIASGILEVMSEGYGFIRCANYLPGENDVYVSPSQIRRFNMKTGDIVTGHKRFRNQGEKFSALLFISDINGVEPEIAAARTPFENLTPIFPNERIRLESEKCNVAMRMVDLISPIGKGQRGMIVAQPKAGKTTLLKNIANAVVKNNPEMHLIVLLIDERPEEVTDMKEAIEGENVEVIYSTFDETPENHRRVSEMVIERAKRLVEHKKDVMILLDSITRLARAYNLVVSPSGRTLSGGLDPAALHPPKRFFGAARNMREGGSLTILATALVETGSKMDDVVYEEFKGTGNMELILDRKLSERRIFPAIDLVKSGTRREDLLLTEEEQTAVNIMRRAFNGAKSSDAIETIINMFIHTRDNADFVAQMKRRRVL